MTGTTLFGIGRCTIGNLRKNVYPLLGSAADKVDFVHSYNLSLKPLRYVQDVDEPQRAALRGLGFVPDVDVQLDCRRQLIAADAVIIEVFPESPVLWQEDHRWVLCSENQTAAMTGAGFRSSRDYPCPWIEGDFADDLAWLRERLRQCNAEAAVIALNGEYRGRDPILQRPVGDERLEDIWNKTTGLAAEGRLADTLLIDANVVLGRLQHGELAFPEQVFPHLYIRHRPNLEPLRVARDTKHASYEFRRQLATELLRALSFEGVDLPDTFTRRHSVDVTERAARYLDAFSATGESALRRQNHHAFSQLLGYVLLTQQHRHLIEACMADLLIEPRESWLLTWLYPMRSLCAYLYEHTTEAAVAWALDNLRRLLHLPPELLHAEYTYALIWMKNIVLVLNRHAHAGALGNKELCDYLKMADAVAAHSVYRRYPTVVDAVRNRASELVV